jgi:hypothetical protein
MFSKEEAQILRKSFWISFGMYMKKHSPVNEKQNGSITTWEYPTSIADFK